MQEDLRKADYAWEYDDDLDREDTKHKQLLDSIDELRAELPIWKEKLKNAKICGPGDIILRTHCAVLARRPASKYRLRKRRRLNRAVTRSRIATAKYQYLSTDNS